MTAMFASGIILAQLIAAPPEVPPSFAVTPAAEPASGDRERNSEPAGQPAEAQQPPDAASLLRHMRGAPGTPYGSSDSEVDRRLQRMIGE